MAIREMLLPEFDHEMASTRKTLERVPEDRPDFKPHEKSMSLARLAGHLAELPMWAHFAFAQDSLDIAPAGNRAWEPGVMESRAQLLEVFDQNVRQARATLASVPDEDFGKPWTLLKTGQTLFTMPKGALLRSFVMNHSVHHRAQLGVYLRLNDVPVPAIYGGSADEAGFA